MALSSSNTDVLRVPASVTVPAGSSSVTFSAETSTVRFATNVVVTATSGGVNRTASITVEPSGLVASFSVTGSSKGDDACLITNNNGTLDCTFDGTGSAGFPSSWKWTMTVGSNSSTTTRTVPTLVPTPGCSVMSGATPVQVDGANNHVVMNVDLVVLTGDAESSATRRNVKIYPNSNCSYSF